MELFILIVAFVLWIIQKKLSASEKESGKRKHRPPIRAPWRDPWGELEDSPLSFPDSPSEDRSFRSRSFPGPGGIEETFQGTLEETGKAMKEAEGVQEAVSREKTPVETLLEDLQTPRPPVLPPKRKKTLKLEGKLLTKQNLVRGIMLHEILGSPPSRRYFRRTYHRSP